MTDWCTAPGPSRDRPNRRPTGSARRCRTPGSRLIPAGLRWRRLRRRGAPRRQRPRRHGCGVRRGAPSPISHRKTFVPVRTTRSCTAPLRIRTPLRMAPNNYRLEPTDTAQPRACRLPWSQAPLNLPTAEAQIHPFGRHFGASPLHSTAGLPSSCPSTRSSNSHCRHGSCQVRLVPHPRTGSDRRARVHPGRRRRRPATGDPRPSGALDGGPQGVGTSRFRNFRN